MLRKSYRLTSMILTLLHNWCDFWLIVWPWRLLRAPHYIFFAQIILRIINLFIKALHQFHGSPQVNQLKPMEDFLSEFNNWPKQNDSRRCVCAIIIRIKSIRVIEVSTRISFLSKWMGKVRNANVIHTPPHSAKVSQHRFFRYTKKKKQQENIEYSKSSVHIGSHCSDEIFVNCLNCKSGDSIAPIRVYFILQFFFLKCNAIWLKFLICRLFTRWLNE